MRREEARGDALTEKMAVRSTIWAAAARPTQWRPLPGTPEIDVLLASRLYHEARTLARRVIACGPRVVDDHSEDLGLRMNKENSNACLVIGAGRSAGSMAIAGASE